MSGNTAGALNSVPFGITNPELIPTARYYDPEFFEAEKQNVWPHVWQMACRLEEIPQIGDYTVYDIFDKSVIMIHTGEGVKGFLNACRHRGVKLAHGPGNCGSEGFVCPFHGWRWNADGENTFIFGRQIFSEDIIARAQVDLAPVRTEYWAGCAFINFDDSAPSLRDSLGPVADRMDARHADKLKMDWWCGTILPTNWKLSMEAFMESYHVMQTHRQLFDLTPNATLHYGRDFDDRPVNEGLDAKQTVRGNVAFAKNIHEGMGGGIVHATEVAVLERLKDMEVPDDVPAATMAYYQRAYQEIEQDLRDRGADAFDIPKVAAEVEFNAVEFMFPHFFLLPMFGAMASYRIRPLTPETCLFEIWSLAIRSDDEPFDTPTEPTMLPYNSQDFPEIPRQDYSNLPIQQLGLHNLDYMRIGKGCNGGDSEGLISNYQRLIDGFIAGRDAETLRKAQNVVNTGFQSPIRDLGF